MAHEQKIPGPDHPITVEKNPERVVVRVGDQLVADTTSALVMRESTYPPVQYVPLADVDQSLLTETDTTTHCAFKGDASYYTIKSAQGDLPDAIWTYRTPYEAVAPIAGHVAFDPEKVDITVG